MFVVDAVYVYCVRKRTLLVDIFDGGGIVVIRFNLSTGSHLSCHVGQSAT